MRDWRGIGGGTLNPRAFGSFIFLFRFQVVARSTSIMRILKPYNMSIYKWSFYTSKCANSLMHKAGFYGSSVGLVQRRQAPLAAQDPLREKSLHFFKRPGKRASASV